MEVENEEKGGKKNLVKEFQRAVCICNPLIHMQYALISSPSLMQHKVLAVPVSGMAQIA